MIPTLHTQMAAELMRRFPSQASDSMKEALRVALDAQTGLNDKRAALTARTDLSAAGQAQELAQYVNRTTKGTIGDVRGRVERAKAALEARRANLMPTRPTTGPEELRHREARDILRGYSAGDFTAAVLAGDRDLLRAVLLSPVPFPNMTAELLQRVTENFVGRDVLESIDAEQLAISMASDAVDRVEKSVENQTAEPRPAVARVA